MAMIVGVNSINYVDKRKLESKLSFKEGEKFFAKICSTDKKTGEATLKLPNGWEFKARISHSDLKENIEFMEGKVIKFQVEDFVDNKLQLSISEGVSNEELTSSLKDILNKLNLEPSKENIELLSKMIKHDIPLTKENIYIFKNTMFIKQRISQGDSEIDNMTKLFLLKSNISEEAPEANFIKEHLKEFFNVLKNTDNDILLSLKENGLELFSKDNINSMKTLNEGNNVFKQSIEELLSTLKQGFDIENLESDFLGNPSDKTMSRQTDAKTYIKTDSKVDSKTVNNIDIETVKDIDSKVDSNTYNKVNGKVDLKLDNTIYKVADNSKDELINKELNSIENNKVNVPSNEKLQELSRIINGDEKIKDKIVKEFDLDNRFIFNDNKLTSKALSVDSIKEMVIDEATKNILLASLKVKEDIESKINELKVLINDVLQLKEKLDPSLQKELIQGIKESITNIKVLNSLTDQYYYLDSSLKYKNKEHEFKLIIKNNNKNKQEFDTKCVKIFASIKTINMGCVDNFININNNNMQIKISCDKHFMKFINKGKDDLIEAVKLIGYLPSVIVEERREETTISNSSDFFQEQTFTMINQLI